MNGEWLSCRETHGFRTKGTSVALLPKANIRSRDVLKGGFPEWVVASTG
jgi:hypothetical protein